MNQPLGLLRKTPSDFKVARSNSKISPNWERLAYFYSSRIRITYSIKFATIELHRYTYLFNTIFGFCSSKRNVRSHNSLFIYQNNRKCFKKVGIRRTKSSRPSLSLKTGCPNHPTAIPSPLSIEPALNNPPLPDYYQYNHKRLIFREF